MGLKEDSAKSVRHHTLFDTRLLCIVFYKYLDINTKNLLKEL